MTIQICSRCKVKREVNLTDTDEIDLINFKTCLLCRNKLKQYRKNFIKRQKNLKIDKDNKSDDKINVIIIPQNINKYIKNGKILKKYSNLIKLFEKFYKFSKLNDIEIDEIIQIDKFTIPHNLIGQLNENINIYDSNEKINLNEENYHNDIEKDIIENIVEDEKEEEDDDDDDDDDDDEETFKNINKSSKYLLSNQTEKDEKLKNDLIESFEIHYINRIKHILKLCELDFKFYVSSWKNGKYYTSFRCIEDKNSLKRFGIDVNKINFNKSEIKENYDNNENKNQFEIKNSISSQTTLLK
ncbi:F-box only protein 3, partial [Pichia californica]